MGRKKKKVIRRRKRQLPKKLFNCPQCGKVKSLVIRIDKKEKETKGSCLCGLSFSVPLNIIKEKITNLATLDYFNLFIVDSYYEFRNLL